MNQRLNRLLAGFAVVVLLLTLLLLYWLRRRAIDDMETSIRGAAASFKQDELLHGLDGKMVYFGSVAESQARRFSIGSIREIRVSRVTAAGEEIPIVPFTMRVDDGPQWREKLLAQNWRREPLGSREHPFGWLYLKLDTAPLASMNWAIGAVGLAIALMLLMLLARLWSQETSLTRTMVELNTRRAELIRIERLALAGQLAASLLHDLRKPVLHIKHSLDDLTDGLDEAVPAQAMIQDLRHQTRLFFQMLSDSQIERFVQSDRAGEEFVDIIPIIEHSLNLVRYERRGVDVVRPDPGPLPPLLAQPFRLIQLFSNLILNAYQALGGRGVLTIEAAAERDGIEVCCTDSGPGIPSEMLDRIFDPFFSTKPEGQGNGLGLAICRMIADDLHGEITVSSRPGGPTTFRVWLPAARPD